MDYVDPADGNLTARWYELQDQVVRAHFDATLLTLRGTRNWETSKQFKELKREHAGLSEIIIDIEVRENKRQFKRHIRPVGIWYPISYVFVILLGCEKSGRIYSPQHAFDTAIRLRTQFVENGKGTLSERL
jgi:hypothetical protein